MIDTVGIAIILFSNVNKYIVIHHREWVVGCVL